MNSCEIVVDNFAGGGGASLGLEWALGRSPDIAINHDAVALELHRLNHPETEHLCKDLFDVDPVQATRGQPVGLAWFSPDCKHFSKAKGGKPVEKKIRGLAWVVIRWAARVKPRIIILENVEEFKTWGPLRSDGRPCKRRTGQTFQQWVGHLEKLGYQVEWHELVAADYGAPTSRKRFFLIARCDGRPIVWPEPTHGPGLLPYRTAAECIDWSIPCPSIFERKRPLAENTLKRIAKGVRRYVIESADPFIVPIHHYNGRVNVHGCDEPLRTITASPKGGSFALAAPYLVKCNHQGQSIEDPVRTVMASSRGHHALCAAFLAKHYGGVVGHELDKPIGAITSVDHHSLVTVRGELYQIEDIGLRMLQPRELARAHGFPDDYKLRGTKTVQVRMIGNSVPPVWAEALCNANYTDTGQEVLSA